MATYAEIKMTVIIPDDDATDEEIEEWIKFETNANASRNLTKSNTLEPYNLEIEDGTFECVIH